MASLRTTAQIREGILPPVFPGEPPRFTHAISAIADFYWRWRQSQYVLTITGSYLEDQRDYPDFWLDVYAYQSLVELSEYRVRETKRVVDEFARSHRGGV